MFKMEYDDIACAREPQRSIATNQTQIVADTEVRCEQPDLLEDPEAEQVSEETKTAQTKEDPEVCDELQMSDDQ